MRGADTIMDVAAGRMPFSWYNESRGVVAHDELNMLSFAMRPPSVPLPPLAGVLR